MTVRTPTSPSATRRQLLQTATTLGAGMAAPQLMAQASALPKGPIRIVVTFAPGGATDTVARLLADKLGKATGGTFLVENKPGAGGMLGTEQVARSTPDGHTFGLVLSGVVYTSPYINKVPMWTATWRWSTRCSSPRASSPCTRPCPPRTSRNWWPT